MHAKNGICYCLSYPINLSMMKSGSPWLHCMVKHCIIIMVSNMASSDIGNDFIVTVKLHGAVFMQVVIAMLFCLMSNTVAQIKRGGSTNQFHPAILKNIQHLINTFHKRGSVLCKILTLCSMENLFKYSCTMSLKTVFRANVS